MRIQMSDSKSGDCEVCNATGIKITKRYQNIWYCDACWTKEQRAIAEHQSPAKQEERVAVYRASLETAKMIDASITIRQDLFNASTVSIAELEASVNADNSIENKAYTIAEMLVNRFNEQKKLMFEYQEKLQQVSNDQKAIQIYLNNKANGLRAEEREKLRLADINYKPSEKAAPKTVRTNKPVKTAKPKIDKHEVRAIAAEYGFSDFMLQHTIIAKQCSPREAAEHLKKMIDAAKSGN